MTRKEAIDISRWACKLSGRPNVRDRITRLAKQAELGDRPWSDLSDYLLREFPENPSLADGVFNG